MSGDREQTVIGIDLGTTFSCVAVFQNGKVEVIANDQGNRTTPSFISFSGNDRIIGEGAKAQAASNLSNTVYDVKRLMGRDFTDPMLQEDIKNWYFKVISNKNKPKVEVEFKGKLTTFSAEELSAMILSRMRQISESYLGRKIDGAVITVPAYFNDAQRQATKDAGRIAGLNILRIINEPTAAALAYGLDKGIKGERHILVFDLGGGTFDVSVLFVDEGQLFQVKSTAGDTHLGGEDFDTRLVDHFVSEFKKLHNVDLKQNLRALRRLRTACEMAKRNLSNAPESLVEVVSIHEGIDFSMKLSRARFDELCLDMFKSTLKPVERALKDAKLSRSKIDEIVLVGGSTRIPKIQKMLKEYFGGKELNKGINPDEAVAYGAAVQAAILSGRQDDCVKDVLLIDVTPLSLGIETVGGVMNKIIERNNRIPCVVHQEFTTNEDNQPGVSVIVYEGERTLTQDNHKLGRFELMGLPPAPRGVPRITIQFEIDSNGILQVTARDDHTGKGKSLVIKGENRLNDKNIKEMIEMSEKYRKEDEDKRRAITARNSLESYMFSVKNSLEDLKQKLKDEDIEEIVGITKLTFEWLESPENAIATADEYDRKYKEANALVGPIMRRLYDADPDGDDAERLHTLYDPEDEDHKTASRGPRIEEVN